MSNNSFPSAGFNPLGWAVVPLPDSRGPILAVAAGAFARQRLADDSIGTTQLTLTNIVAGSRFRIEVASTGALCEPAANTTGVFSANPITLKYYPASNPLNSVRIKVRKSSAAPLYKPFETLTTIGASAQSVYIAQIPD